MTSAGRSPRCSLASIPRHLLTPGKEAPGQSKPETSLPRAEAEKLGEVNWPAQGHPADLGQGEAEWGASTAGNAGALALSLWGRTGNRAKEEKPFRGPKATGLGDYCFQSQGS